MVVLRDVVSGSSLAAVVGLLSLGEHLGSISKVSSNLNCSVIL